MNRLKAGDKITVTGAFALVRLCTLGFALCAAVCATAQQGHSLPSNDGLPSLPIASQAQSGTETTASVSGTVTDRDGALIAGARVTLRSPGPARTLTTETGGDGHFLLTGVPAGNFELVVSSTGEVTATRHGLAPSGEIVEIGAISLEPEGTTADVQVNATQREVAEAELKVEETQRVAGFIPNFYVSYDWQAAPLSAGQKYQLAFRTIVDPATFLLNGVSAGIEQAQNTFPGYGQGASGYGKRFAANYGDAIAGTLLGGAVFAQWMHQDPRYFYKGTGSIKHRLLYALETTVVCRGDNGHFQPCYSSILGDLASGAISNAYYPASDRHGAALTIEQGFLSVGFDGIGNVIQEFLIRRLTPHPPTYSSTSAAP